MAWRRCLGVGGCRRLWRPRGGAGADGRCGAARRAADARGGGGGGVGPRPRRRPPPAPPRGRSRAAVDERTRASPAPPRRWTGSPAAPAAPVLVAPPGLRGRGKQHGARGQGPAPARVRAAACVTCAGQRQRRHARRRPRTAATRAARWADCRAPCVGGGGHRRRAAATAASLDLPLAPPHPLPTLPPPTTPFPRVITICGGRPRVAAAPWWDCRWCRGPWRCTRCRRTRPACPWARSWSWSTAGPATSSRGSPSSRASSRSGCRASVASYAPRRGRRAPVGAAAAARVAAAAAPRPGCAPPASASRRRRPTTRHRRSGAIPRQRSTCWDSWRASRASWRWRRRRSRARRAARVRGRHGWRAWLVRAVGRGPCRRSVAAALRRTARELSAWAAVGAPKAAARPLT
jgi:hypothetical protein